MSAEPAEPPAGSPARRGTAWLWWALALLPPVPWLVGLAARWHWFAELFTHFRFQWLLGAGGVGVLLLIARKWRPLALCGLAALILGSPLLGSAASSRALRSGNWEGDLTVCTANVLTRNRRSGELIEAIKERAPDVLCLQEIDARWAEDLMALHATYPYREVVPRQDNFGIAVYSKLPATFETVDLEGVPMMKAVVDLREERDAAARELTVFNVHTLPPVGRSNAARRNRQMADVAQRVRAEIRRSPQPNDARAVLVCADLNCTPWSPYFADLLREGGLTDSRHGGREPTSWRRRNPLFALPIDHVLVGGAASVLQLEAGPQAGSDHTPLFARVGVWERPAR